MFNVQWCYANRNASTTMPIPRTHNTVSVITGCFSMPFANALMKQSCWRYRCGSVNAPKLPRWLIAVNARCFVDCNAPTMIDCKDAMLIAMFVAWLLVWIVASMIVMFIGLLISWNVVLLLDWFLVQNYNKYIVRQNKIQEKYNIYLKFNFTLQLQSIYLQ